MLSRGNSRRKSLEWGRTGLLNIVGASVAGVKWARVVQAVRGSERK